MSGYFDARGSYNKETIVDFRSIGTRKMTEDSKRSRMLKENKSNTKLIEGFNTIPFFSSLIANENTLSAFDLNSVETKTFGPSLDVSSKGSNISNSHETDTKQIMKIANININREVNEYNSGYDPYEFNYVDLYDYNDKQPNLYSKLDSNTKSDNKRLYTRRRYSKAQPDPVYYYDTINQ